jgi:hypothetical protein
MTLNIRSNLSQSLSPRLRLRVEIRCLSQTAHSVTSSGVDIVVRGAMPSRTVIPDCHIIPVPLETNLGVVILSDQLLPVSHPE